MSRSRRFSRPSVQPHERPLARPFARFLARLFSRPSVQSHERPIARPLTRPLARPLARPFARLLTRLIDSLYLRPFRAMMPLQTFRYLACGGMNFALTIVCYAVAYNFIFAKQNFDALIVVLSPHVAALGISTPVNFFAGFWLQRNISFRHSPLRGRVQLFRYFATALAGVLLTYALTKLFVDVCHIFPTVAQVMIYCISAVFSFTAHKHFNFRGAEGTGAVERTRGADEAEKG